MWGFGHGLTSLEGFTLSIVCHKPQHQTHHFYSAPSPSPPAISFLILSAPWKRPTNAHFFFIYKNFLNCVTHHNTKGHGESAGNYFRKPWLHPLVVGTFFTDGSWEVVGWGMTRDCHSWCSQWGCVTSFALIVQSTWCFWNRKPQGTNSFPSRTAGQSRGHKLAEKWERPWSP